MKLFTFFNKPASNRALFLDYFNHNNQINLVVYSEKKVLIIVITGNNIVYNIANTISLKTLLQNLQGHKSHYKINSEDMNLFLHDFISTLRVKNCLNLVTQNDIIYRINKVFHTKKVITQSNNNYLND